MRTVSDTYKEITARNIRNRGYGNISIGVISNEMQSTGSVTSETAEWCSPDTIFSDEADIVEFATLEENFFKVNGSMRLLPETITEQVDEAISADVLGGITLTFDDAYPLKGLTIDFGEYYPTEFTIETDNGTTTYTNSRGMFSTADDFGDVSYLTITPTSMVGGYQRLRILNVGMGIGIVFENSDIKNISIEDFVSPVSTELPYIKVSATIIDTKGIFDVDNTDSFIDYLEQGQTVTIKLGLEDDDSDIMWLQMGVYALSDWDSQKGIVTIEATDWLSQKEDTYTAGNQIYTRTAYEEAESILTDAGFDTDEYEIDDYLSDITLTNPMPEASHKECLQLLANACRCLVRQDVDGKTIIAANFSTVIDPTDMTLTTNGVADWSTPENILDGTASVVYADLTQDFFAIDETLYLMDEGETFLSTAGYVSSEVSDSDGLFSTNPAITVELPAAYGYYNIEIAFDGNVPHALTVHVYNSDVLAASVDFTDLEAESSLYYEYPEFDKFTIEFTEADPYSRVLVKSLELGDVTNYTLEKKSMKSHVHGFIEEKTRRVDTKIYTFEDDGSGTPVEVEDSVYYSETINSVGSVRTICNQLISTEELAQDLTEWMANYYENNKSYDVTFNGEPMLEASDIIKMESDYSDNLQVCIERQTLDFNGVFSGTLELRKALKSS